MVNNIKDNRLAFIDALRGIAALYVVLYHLTLIPRPFLELPEFVKPIIMFGGSGVTLFFIVSAYSLFRTMPNRLREERPVASFYIHRFFRIAPMFYTIFIVSYIRDIYLNATWHGPLEILESLTFVFALIPSHGIVWAGWTISVEAVFYAIFPLLYNKIQSIAGAMTFLFVTFIICYLSNMLTQKYVSSDATAYYLRYISIFRHAPAFATGTLLFMLVARLPRLPQTAQRVIGIIFICLAVGAFNGMSTPLFYGILPDAYSWQLIIYSFLFMGLLLNPILPLVNPVTTFCGRLSFSLYLIHPILVYFLVPIYRSIYLAAQSNGIAYSICAGLTFVILIPLSYLTCVVIEEPGIALGKRVYRAFANRRQMQLVEPDLKDAGALTEKL